MVGEGDDPQPRAALLNLQKAVPRFDLFHDIGQRADLRIGEYVLELGHRDGRARFQN